MLIDHLASCIDELVESHYYNASNDQIQVQVFVQAHLQLTAMKRLKQKGSPQNAHRATGRIRHLHAIGILHGDFKVNREHEQHALPS